MHIAAFGALIFLLGFMAHAALWRLRRPQNHTASLLVIFSSFFAAGIFFAAWLRDCSLFDLRPPVGIFEWLRCTFFYVALVFAYLTTYSAVEVDSPSLLIVLKIAEAGGQGLRHEELLKALTDKVVVLPRLRDLVRGGMVKQAEDKFIISAKGRFFCGIFVLFRRLLGAPKGG